MGRFVSKDQLLMRQLWRKAVNSPNGLRMEFPTEANAHRARMMLYNAVKEAKQGAGEDHELIHAAESIEVVYGESKRVLMMRHRSDSPIFQALEEAVGYSLREQKMPGAEASLEKLLKELGPGTNDQNAPAPAHAREEAPKPSAETGLATTHKPNPFYDRSKG